MRSKRGKMMNLNDDVERVDEMAVFRCSPATMKANEELTNAFG